MFNTDLPSHIPVVSEVVKTLQLKDQSDVIGDLSVCLDGLTVDPEMFATAEVEKHSKSQQSHELDEGRLVTVSSFKTYSLCLDKNRMAGGTYFIPALSFCNFVAFSLRISKQNYTLPCIGFQPP